MAEYLGISKFCSKCKHSHAEGEDIICEWKDGLKVNSIRCAPCFIEGADIDDAIYENKNDVEKYKTLIARIEGDTE